MIAHKLSFIGIGRIGSLGNCSMRCSRSLFQTRFYLPLPWGRTSCITHRDVGNADFAWSKISAHAVVPIATLLTSMDGGNADDCREQSRSPSLAVVLLLLLLEACTPLPQRDPAFAPVAPADLRPPAQSSGSIYQAGYDMRLFEDNKAMRVGDILTIKFNELTQAKKKDDLNAKKDNEISVAAPTLFGMAASVLSGKDVETKLASKKDFNGEGEANQSNSLRGDISVTVVELLPNGNLRVRGEKRVTLNQGDEYVRLSGIVRPVDVDTANTISSDKVADATIMYTGNGAMADASKMGWLSRILFSPWFPF